MRILFSYIVPSGGMETLNRIRSETLMRYEIKCHLHYQQHGAGLQNISGISTHVINDDESISKLLATREFDAAIVSSDFLMLERLRQLGFTGPIVYEAQGLGTLEQAMHYIQEAEPFIISYANALLYPPTSHLTSLFKKFESLPHYSFPNCVDTENFKYHAHPKYDSPIIGWVGRMEKNKNWRDFLNIGSMLITQYPKMRLWMFDDANIYIESERIAFFETVQQLSLSRNIERFSNVKHSAMPNCYSIIGDSGGFLLSTSILEGFGYAVAEAMSCRCPVLTTNSDGICSFIEHNVTGKFYSVGQIQNGFQEGLEFIQNHELRESIRNQGRAFVENNFKLDSYAEHFMTMLQNLGARN
jgi:L-malate glycosyltransferase